MLDWRRPRPLHPIRVIRILRSGSMSILLSTIARAVIYMARHLTESFLRNRMRNATNLSPQTGKSAPKRAFNESTATFFHISGLTTPRQDAMFNIIFVGGTCAEAFG